MIFIKINYYLIQIKMDLNSCQTGIYLVYGSLAAVTILIASSYHHTRKYSLDNNNLNKTKPPANLEKTCQKH